MPGCGSIPEFVAWEHAVLNSQDPINPSAIAAEILELLENETDSAQQIAGSKIMDFAANYIKWMFKVLQTSDDPKRYQTVDMDPT